MSAKHFCRCAVKVKYREVANPNLLAEVATLFIYEIERLICKKCLKPVAQIGDCENFCPKHGCLCGAEK